MYHLNNSCQFHGARGVVDFARGLHSSVPGPFEVGKGITSIAGNQRCSVG